MPHYIRGTGGGQITRQQTFRSIDEMSHFLTKTHGKDWETFQGVAKDILTGKRVPSRRLKKKSLHAIATKPAHHLLPELHGEVQKYYDQEDIGGGIIEALHTVGNEFKHLVGWDYFKKILGFTPTSTPTTLHSEIMAYLVDETYKKEGDRKDNTVGYSRLTKYDSSEFSVYQKDKDGELVVCVRGTKMNWNDISQDLQILVGKQVASERLDKLLDRIESDFPEKKYDVAAHSLGAMQVYSEFNEHRDNMDEIFFFNPASSPFQDTDMLKDFANQEDVFYYMNQGDVVSNALYQQMSDHTLEANMSLGPYRHLPFAAHSMSQWYNDGMHETIATDPQGPDYDNQKSSIDTAVFGQDTQETQEAGLS